MVPSEDESSVYRIFFLCGKVVWEKVLWIIDLGQVNRKGQGGQGMISIFLKRKKGKGSLPAFTKVATTSMSTEESEL